ncbi:MAG TPA: class I SAM-dependent methyltransferase [Acidimicrobiales bacterium]|nr:class I SAM-dependent methyltransferase [Acidimicrobiales bacterium]
MDRDGWDARYAATELVWSAGPNQLLVAEVDGLAPGRALDLACGEGRNALWLASRGWDVVGVDFSGVAIDKAREIAERRGLDVDWVTADVTTYRPAAAAFDLVVVVYLHLPAPQLRAVLASAVHAVAPEGVLVVIGHDITNLTEGHGGPQDPNVLYGPDDIAPALAGLVVDKAERVRRTVDTDHGPSDAIDVVVRARRA